MRAALLLLAGAVLAAPPWGAGPLRAQPRVVTQEVWAEAPVEEDNLAEARRKAISIGHQYLLLAMMKKMVKQHWMTEYEKEIKARILNRKNRYIQSFVVEQEKPSLDRTKFQVVMNVQINRDQLKRDLRDFPLPLKDDPPATVTLVYPAADPLLRNSRLRAAMLKNLNYRLYPLKYKLETSVALTGGEAAAMQDLARNNPIKKNVLGRFKTDAVLFYGHTLLPPVPAQPDAPAGRGTLLLYRQEDGALLGQAALDTPRLRHPPPGRNEKERSSVLYTWITPLIRTMAPLSFRPMGAGSGRKTPLTLRVVGFSSVEDQDAFEQAFVQAGSSFAGLRLVRLSSQAVSYNGPYSEDRTRLRRELTRKKVGDFRITRVVWYEDVLEIKVKRTRRPRPREMMIYPQTKRSAEAQSLIENFLQRPGKLEMEEPNYAEREDNGWLTRANSIPFNATVYGYMDSRSDRDVYVGEALTPGEKVTLIWYRISRTLLTPAIRLYDADGVLVKTFLPRTAIRYTYTLPPGQRRFYLEISDRFGPLTVDTGGYLQFHYLFKAKRKRR